MGKRPVLTLDSAIKITHSIQLVKDNFFVIFPSYCSHFLVLYSIQKQELFVAELKNFPLPLSVFLRRGKVIASFLS